MTQVAAFTVWSGAAMIVLGDGRRSLALGMALIGGGVAALAWVDGNWLGGSFLLIGGAASALLRLRAGRRGWGFMPPGSTPWLILVVVGGLLALWIGASVATGPGAPLRFAALVVIGMMGARALATTDSSVAISAVAALALCLGAASALSDVGPGVAPYLLAAIVAAGTSFIRTASLRGA